MLASYFHDRTSVSDTTRLACVAALKAAGINETACEPLADQLIELVQQCAVGVCEGNDWPSAAKIRRELMAALTPLPVAERALVGLSAPSLALLQDAMKASYGPSLTGLTHVELGLETALEHIDDEITGKTGRIYLLLRSSALRWREASGAWPARTNDPQEGVATTPFLRILRSLLKDAMPDGRDVPKISDHMFRKALEDARKRFHGREDEARAKGDREV